MPVAFSSFFEPTTGFDELLCVINGILLCSKEVVDIFLHVFFTGLNSSSKSATSCFVLAVTASTFCLYFRFEAKIKRAIITAIKMKQPITVNGAVADAVSSGIVSIVDVGHFGHVRLPKSFSTHLYQYQTTFPVVSKQNLLKSSVRHPNISYTFASSFSLFLFELFRQVWE